MDLVGFSVEFHEIRPKVRADNPEGVPQLLQPVGIENPASILRDKDKCAWR